MINNVFWLVRDGNAVSALCLDFERIRAAILSVRKNDDVLRLNELECMNGPAMTRGNRLCVGALSIKILMDD